MVFLFNGSNIHSRKFFLETVISTFIVQVSFAHFMTALKATTGLDIFKSSSCFGEGSLNSMI